MKTCTSLLLGLLLLISGCQTTEILNTWSEGPQDHQFDDVLIIAVLKETAYRNIVEQRMVETMLNLGIEAESASELYPDTGQLDQATIDGLVKKSGADSVMIIRLVDTRKETVYTPGTVYIPGGYGGRYSRGYYGYYGGGFSVMSTPGYSTQYNISTVETTVFDAASNTRVWSTITQTTETSINKAIDSYIKVISQSINQSGLF